MSRRQGRAAPDLQWRQGGLSLIELIVFIVIVSVALVGVLSVLNLTVAKSADPMIRKQALAVAEGMMEEILTKDYQNDPANPCAPSCVPNTVLDRQNYNNVDAYNGWNQPAVYQIDGTPAPVVGTFTVNVGVVTATLSGVAAKQITVTVASGVESISLVGFRTNYE